jgi:hypothetical protein
MAEFLLVAGEDCIADASERHAQPLTLLTWIFACLHPAMCAFNAWPSSGKGCAAAS